MGQEECNLLVAYVQAFPFQRQQAGRREEASAQIKAGEATFKAIGCTNCHLPKLGEAEGSTATFCCMTWPPARAIPTRIPFRGGPPARRSAPACRSCSPGADMARPVSGERPRFGAFETPGLICTTVAPQGSLRAIAFMRGQAAQRGTALADLPPRRKQQIEVFLMSLASPRVDR